MKTKITFQDHQWEIDLQKPLDISIPLNSEASPNCFYAPKYRSYPVETDNFIGDTSKGGLVNFYNIEINPHGNGTHTECVGHISTEKILLRDCLKIFHFPTIVISVTPVKTYTGDLVIGLKQLEEVLQDVIIQPALVIRTLPNSESKLSENYSGQNPPYFEAESIQFLIDKGVNHLLTDLPSVDREEDGGKLASHKTFWNYPDEISLHRTITELIFVNNDIVDGEYVLNLMIGNYDIDASPSKPILYRRI